MSAETKIVDAKPAEGLLNSNAPADAAASQENLSTAAPHAAAEKTGKDFLAAFGQQGAVWFVEGKSWDEAQAAFTAGLKDENDKLKAKLAAAAFGQPTPVSAEPADDDAQSRKTAALANRIGGNVARFAAGIRLPGPSKN
jgi:hypothetical protein